MANFNSRIMTDITTFQLEILKQFKSELFGAVDKSVHTRKTGNLFQSRKRTNENVPMNKKLWAKIKKK